MTEKSKWVGTAEVATTFSVCRATVYYWITEKKYFHPIKRVGSRYQVLREQVDQYLEHGMTPPRSADPNRPSAAERRRIARKGKRTAAKDIAGAIAMAAKGGGKIQAG